MGNNNKLLLRQSWISRAIPEKLSLMKYLTQKYLSGSGGESYNNKRKMSIHQPQIRAKVVNNNGTVAAFETSDIQDKRYNLRKALIELLSIISEDLVTPTENGNEAWDMQRVLTRRFEGRSLESCRHGFIRENLLLILDTSGSCNEMAQFYGEISMTSAQLGLVDICDGQNGDVTRGYDGSKKIWRDADELYKLSWYWNDKKNWPKNRNILYFGDFDAARHIYTAMEYSNINFFSRVPIENWEKGVTRNNIVITPGTFKGKFYHCPDKLSFFKIVKRLSLKV